MITTEQAIEFAGRWAAWDKHCSTPREVRPETGPSNTLGPHEKASLFAWVRDFIAPRDVWDAWPTPDAQLAAALGVDEKSASRLSNAAGCWS